MANMRWVKMLVNEAVAQAVTAHEKAQLAKGRNHSDIQTAVLDAGLVALSAPARQSAKRKK